MKKSLVLLVVMQLCIFANSLNDSTISEFRKPNLGIYLLEGGASFFAGNVIGIGVPILLTSTLSLGEGHDFADPNFAYFLLYPALYSFSSAFAIDLTAKAFKCKGAYWGAVGGGLIGIGLGIGSYILLCEASPQVYMGYWWSFIAILPPLCSTTGYNLFRKKDASQSSFFLNKGYSVAKSYSIENTAVSQFPKISIKVIEFKF